MAEDFRHRYDKWSKNNLIIEVERLKRKVWELQGLDSNSLQQLRWQKEKEVKAEVRRQAIAKQKVEQLPAHRRNHLEEHELVPKDIGGGIVIMVPPGTE